MPELYERTQYEKGGGLAHSLRYTLLDTKVNEPVEEKVFSEEYFREGR